MQRINKGLERHDGDQQCCGGFKKLIRPPRFKTGIGHGYTESRQSTEKI